MLVENPIPAAPGPDATAFDLRPATGDLELALAAIRHRWRCEATTAVILGSGLGDLADEIDEEAAIAYRDIPGFTHSTALAHKGRLICGQLGGQPVVILQGRCHLYEGQPLSKITFPTRVLAALGIRNLLVTNAAGGLNPGYAIGDVMLIQDHINLMGVGSQWPAPAKPPEECPTPVRQPAIYDRELALQAMQAARQSNFILQRGVYVAVTGPCYETRAEYRAFRRMGGDCVGMSTVPETLTAARLGLRVLGLSTVTNVARPDAPQIVSADEVVEVAASALPKVRAIVRGLLAGTN